MELPLPFRERMKQMLGDEYGEFLESYDRERSQGLRLNLLKTGREEFLAKTSFMLEPIPWAESGFYYQPQDRPGRHPYHEAGVYYIQEPSAMAVVSFLDPQPGEKVLDLCAAPGGKTTQIASRLQGKGFLLSNEIHPARARILSQNVERMGVRNAVVTNEDSGRLAEYFPEARLIAFSSGEEETDFLADRHYVTGGLTLMTSELPVEQGKDGMVYRCVLEQLPTVLSGFSCIQENPPSRWYWSIIWEMIWRLSGLPLTGCLRSLLTIQSIRTWSSLTARSTSITTVRESMIGWI